MGVSTDAKPHLTGVGGSFTELDTGAKYLWNGEQWVEDLTMIYALSEALALQRR